MVGMRRISALDKGRRSLLVPSHTGAMAYRDTFRKWNELYKKIDKPDLEPVVRLDKQR